jgi:hypothetical protein
MSDLPMNQRRVSAAETGVQKPAGVASSVFDAGRMAKPPKRALNPPIDPDTVEIRKGVPMPGARGAWPTDRYGAILGRMQPGDMVELESKQAANMRMRAKKLGIEVAVRALGDGRAGVWMLTRAEGKAP